VFGDLFAFDQGDLPAARLAGAAADFAEITRFAADALACDDFDFADGLQWGTGFGRVKMQGNHARDGSGRGWRAHEGMVDGMN
jgi:hypothetical protein